MSVENVMTTPPPVSPATTPAQPPVSNVSTASPSDDSAAQGNRDAQQGGVSVEKLQAAVDRMNELMQNGQRSLNFSVDTSTEQVVVKVMDVQTKEVVRQIPNEETLKFAEYLEGMVGLLFDEEA